MKKMPKTVIRMMTVMAVCVSLAAFSGQTTEAKAEANPETKTKKAYQTLNEGIYVLEGTVTMAGDRVTACDIVEINTMLMWGNVSNNTITKEEIAKLGDDNIQPALFQGHGGDPVDTRFAKYVQVGDVIFTAGVESKGLIFYTSDKTGEVISYFEKSEDNIAWYIEQMRAGNYWLLKKTGDSFEKLDLASFYRDATGEKLEKGKSQNKKSSKHWEGWLPNIKKIENFFVKNGFIEGEFNQDANGVWAVADAVSGATIAEFGGYAGILYKAYKK
ncbi:hypothetical protein OAC89_02925 [Deltaproteobacteria bacterium]|nr:hypothetical protein [Deltaproteobacteria bacterium]